MSQLNLNVCIKNDENCYKALMCAHKRAHPIHCHSQSQSRSLGEVEVEAAGRGWKVA